MTVRCYDKQSLQVAASRCLADETTQQRLKRRLELRFGFDSTIYDENEHVQ